MKTGIHDFELDHDICNALSRLNFSPVWLPRSLLAPGSRTKPEETGTGRCKISNCETGDIACDSYHNIERDVQSAKDLNLQQYRFSLSWARILPTGYGSSDKIKYDTINVT